MVAGPPVTSTLESCSEIWHTSALQGVLAYRVLPIPRYKDGPIQSVRSKFQIAADCSHDIDEWRGWTEETVPTTQRALGDGVALLIDAISGFSPEWAISIGLKSGL